MLTVFSQYDIVCTIVFINKHPAYKKFICVSSVSKNVFILEHVDIGPLRKCLYRFSFIDRIVWYAFYEGCRRHGRCFDLYSIESN